MKFGGLQDYTNIDISSEARKLIDQDVPSREGRVD